MKDGVKEYKITHSCICEVCGAYFDPAPQKTCGPKCQEVLLARHRATAGQRVEEYLSKLTPEERARYGR